MKMLMQIKYQTKRWTVWKQCHVLLFFLVKFFLYFKFGLWVIDKKKMSHFFFYICKPAKSASITNYSLLSDHKKYCCILGRLFTQYIKVLFQPCKSTKFPCVTTYSWPLFTCFRILGQIYSNLQDDWVVFLAQDFVEFPCTCHTARLSS